MNGEPEPKQEAGWPAGHPEPLARWTDLAKGGRGVGVGQRSTGGFAGKYKYACVSIALYASKQRWEEGPF